MVCLLGLVSAFAFGPVLKGIVFNYCIVVYRSSLVTAGTFFPVSVFVRIVKAQSSVDCSSPVTAIRTFVEVLGSIEVNGYEFVVRFSGVVAAAALVPVTCLC